jgi:hypothetical protein
VSEGELTLTVATLSYRYTIMNRNSCTQAILSFGQVTGRFELSGGVVTLYVVGAGGERIIPTTHVGDTIGIHASNDFYYYAKP